MTEARHNAYSYGAGVISTTMRTQHEGFFSGFASNNLVDITYTSAEQNVTSKNVTT